MGNSLAAVIEEIKSITITALAKNKIRGKLLAPLVQENKTKD